MAMTPADLAGIADILPLETPSRWPAIVAAAILLAAVGALVFFVWRHLHPLARIERKLRSGKITSREAAHLLARHAGKNRDVARALDALRFSRRPPERGELLNTIERLRG